MGFDGYGAISASDVMAFLRAVWRFSSLDRRRKFLESKSLLILVVGFKFWKDF